MALAVGADFLPPNLLQPSWPGLTRPSTRTPGYQGQSPTERAQSPKSPGIAAGRVDGRRKAGHDGVGCHREQQRTRYAPTPGGKPPVPIEDASRPFETVISVPARAKPGFEGVTRPRSARAVRISLCFRPSPLSPSGLDCLNACQEPSDVGLRGDPARMEAILVEFLVPIVAFLCLIAAAAAGAFVNVRVPTGICRMAQSRSSGLW